MLEALSAEALKMRTHKATWFLVWLFPIAFTIIMLLMIGAGIAGVDKPEQPNLHSWLENTTLIWFVPNNAVGRYLLCAFVAVVFAGEYGWNTWKLIVPHRGEARHLRQYSPSFVATACSDAVSSPASHSPTICCR